ncbi:hypothetical protein [Clostridium hydrogenum]|uniref:hypothetical protein n=1 Tax=Clostridium hydrogenum TaxID=2855764 RepID=UPI001F2CE5E5|nr:hypothetical protein [Clostridium hydrogenum]
MSKSRNIKERTASSGSFLFGYFLKANEFMEYLCNNGYETTLKFIDNWNFNKYIREHRSGSN